MWVKKQQLEPCMEQLTGSRLRKEYDKAVYCHPVYLTYMQSSLCKIPDWMNYKLESIKIAGRNTDNLRYVDDITLVAESEEELKSLLMRVKEELEKASLKLNIKKTKIMASNPITSCQMEEEKMEAVTGFLFLGFEITADGGCSHEIRRQLLLGRKAITNLDSDKSRDITFAEKVHIVKAVVFPGAMYGCEIWTIKEGRMLKN